MNKSHFSTFVESCLIAGMMLSSGCGVNGEATPVQEENPKPAASKVVVTKTATIKPTDTETPLPSLTPSFTPTITDTPTFTPSPTPNMIMPGNYYVGRCASTTGEYDSTISFCVTGVRVPNDRHMFFDVTWTITGIPSGITVTKRSDYGNKNMYLMDNLGNRYDHITGGGSAYSSPQMVDGVPTTGWFEFGSPPVGALTFDFHDDDTRLVIKKISLIPGFGYIQYDTLILDQYPLTLQYDEEKWDPTKSEDGTNILTNKSLATCTIQPRITSEPIGKLKSQTGVGDIEYKIYGYFDNSLDLYIREYVYVSGLKGIDSNIKPFFYVTIPEDKSKECIVAVSNVLARLGLPEQ